MKRFGGSKGQIVTATRGSTATMPGSAPTTNGHSNGHGHGDRDLEVRPEGGRFGELLVRKQLVEPRHAHRGPPPADRPRGKRLGALLVDAGRHHRRGSWP